MENKQEKIKGSVWIAIVFIIVGVIMVLNNLGVIEYGVWETVWKLWPIVLVAFGVGLLVKRK